MKVTLTPKSEFDFPAGLDNITPDEFKDKSQEEIENISVYKGSKELKISDIFQVESEDSGGSEVEIIIDGDIPNGKRLGKEMSEGKIKVLGDVGMYVGAFMSGGEIEIEGDAGSWAGQKMSGGKLLIKGDADEFLGATYRGDWEGMGGGKIIVEGNAGDQVGEWLDGGEIEINGNTGLHAGFHMKSGTILVNGDIEERVGGQMQGGNIVIKGALENVLPGFSYEEEVNGVEVNGTSVEGEFIKFTGDKAEDGEGNLFVSKAENEHLAS